MDKQEFIDLLSEVIQQQFEDAEIINFDDAGLMTRDDGLIVALSDGQEYRLTIQRAK